MTLVPWPLTRADYHPKFWQSRYYHCPWEKPLSWYYHSPWVKPLSQSLVIITWLADSCRNRMLRHCPTDDRIIDGKKKGEWPLFLWEFKLLWCILCSSQSMCDICNSQFCGQQPNYALTPALLQRNTEKLSSLSLQSSYKCLDWTQ